MMVLQSEANVAALDQFAHSRLSDLHGERRPSGEPGVNRIRRQWL
jgi:hypothetical protein